ncbi:MAG: rhomboid family intramembrane serine protease [Candidatus Bathyarchaeota archaeon]|nr:MAG: rhomboid family intramembrane serine protease [Candidatus Bathyarchaeota archaeon]
MKLTGRLSPTFILMFLNLLVYIYTSLVGGNFIVTDDLVLQIYGQFNYAVLYQGTWWQLLTSVFVHVSIIHFITNMFFLLLFGLRAEELFSDSEYYIVYLLSGISGGIFSLLWPLRTVSAGASGAIFGLFGSVLIFMRSVVGRSVLGALLMAFLFLIITVSSTVNVLAHLGGLMAGLGVGYFMARRRRAICSLLEY